VGRTYVVSQLWFEQLDSIPCFEEALAAVSCGHS
jgi:hypothetical protein